MGFQVQPDRGLSLVGGWTGAWSDAGRGGTSGKADPPSVILGAVRDNHS